MPDEQQDELSSITSEKIHARVDSVWLDVKRIVKELSELRSDIRVIKTTCIARGETCAAHVGELAQAIRGDGGEAAGLGARVSIIEKRNPSKDKVAWFIIGCLSSGIVSLFTALIATH